MSDRIFGLHNIGNTCYFNSGLQALLSSKELVESLGWLTPGSKEGFSQLGQCRKVHQSHYFVWHELRDITYYNDPDALVINPAPLVAAVAAAHPQFEGLFQQDSAELVHQVLSSVDDATRIDLTPTEVLKFWTTTGQAPGAARGREVMELMSDVNRANAEAHVISERRAAAQKGKSEMDISPFHPPRLYGGSLANLFRGYLLSSVLCHRCGATSDTIQEYTTLSVDIPTVAARRRFAALNPEFVRRMRSQWRHNSRYETWESVSPPPPPAAEQHATVPTEPTAAKAAAATSSSSSAPKAPATSTYSLWRALGCLMCSMTLLRKFFTWLSSCCSPRRVTLRSRIEALLEAAAFEKITAAMSADDTAAYRHRTEMRLIMEDIIAFNASVLFAEVSPHKRAPFEVPAEYASLLVDTRAAGYIPHRTSGAIGAGDIDYPLTLEECLGIFTAPVELEEGQSAYHCERCCVGSGDRSPGQQTVRMLTVPHTLAIHLKRIRQEEYSEGSVSKSVTKITDAVVFPSGNPAIADSGRALHTNAFMTKRVSLPEDCPYHLAAVVNHSGSAHGGHYYAAGLREVGSGKKTWIRFNDERVSESKIQDVIFEGSIIGSLFLYTRANTADDDDTKPTPRNDAYSDAEDATNDRKVVRERARAILTAFSCSPRVAEAIVEGARDASTVLAPRWWLVLAATTDVPGPFLCKREYITTSTPVSSPQTPKTASPNQSPPPLFAPCVSSTPRYPAWWFYVPISRADAERMVRVHGGSVPPPGTSFS